MYALTTEDTFAVAGGNPAGDTMIEAGDQMMYEAKVAAPVLIGAGGTFGAAADVALFALGAAVRGAGVTINHYNVGPNGGTGAGSPGGYGGTPTPPSKPSGLQCSNGSTSWDNDHTVTYHPGSCSSTP